MSFQSEIETNYTDSNWLVCNRKCKSTDINPSGNGVCYTSEYVCQLNRRNELTKEIESDYFHAINDCMIEPGLLCRGPGDKEPESVDDYYGLAAGCQATDHVEIAEMVIEYGWKHLGAFNNVNPGKWTISSFLWRQPQLIYTFYTAARKLPTWYRPWTWFLYLLEIYSAIVIATSGMFTSPKNWDAWRLNWLLIQSTSPVSRLCQWAAEIWYKRLFDSFSNGMVAVYAGYFETGHPMIKYGVTK